jgi:hypothetical protein
MEPNAYHIPENDKSKTSFKVPEAYFDKLPRRVQDRVSIDKKSYWRSYQIVLKPAIAMFVVFAVITTVWLSLDKDANLKKPLTRVQVASTDDVLAYELQEHQIIDYLVTEPETESSEITDQETSTLIEYVSDEGIDLTQENLEFQ